jgi:hypothetical protein
MLGRYVCCGMSCMRCVHQHVAMLSILSLLPSYTPTHRKKKNCTCYVRLVVVTTRFVTTFNSDEVIPDKFRFRKFSLLRVCFELCRVEVP